MCRALFTQPWCLWNWEVPVPSEPAHVPICSAPVEEAQTMSGSSFDGYKRYNTQRLCLPLFFLALSFSPSCLSMQKCSSIFNAASPTCTRCARHCLLFPWLLLVSASSSVKKRSWSKILDYLRAGAKQFQVQNLLDPC